MSDAAQLQSNRCLFFGQWISDFQSDPNCVWTPIFPPRPNAWLIGGRYPTSNLQTWCTDTSAALLAGTFDPDLANREINRYIYGGCTQFGFVCTSDMVQDIVAYTRQNGGDGTWWNGWYGDLYWNFADSNP